MFRFENAWTKEPVCSQIVKEVWDMYVGQSIQEKILRCGDRLM